VELAAGKRSPHINPITVIVGALRALRLGGPTAARELAVGLGIVAERIAGQDGTDGNGA